MLLEARISTKLVVNYAAAPDVGAARQASNDLTNFTLTDGVGAGQAQKYWQDTRTIAAASSDSLDLSGGISDVFGNALALTGVKVLRIRAAAANLSDVIVGGAAANAFMLFADATDKLPIKPGGELFLTAPDPAGYPVVNTSADILKVANAGAGAVTYTIEIIGK
jgi:hypothetical protein